VREGDAIVGLAASGLHSNGYSLVRRVLGDEKAPDFLLTPTAIYARKLLALADEVEVHAAAHITGGGIPGNVGRALPDGLRTRIDTASWPRPAVYDWLAERGVSDDEVSAMFNLGLGMLVVTPNGDRAANLLSNMDVAAYVVGEVTRERGEEAR
jgi:phosphoribosylformylglycinamidine cyclo-ligase